jgi:hypothetical protein
MRALNWFLLVLLAFSALSGCKRVYNVPPLVSPVAPRRSLDAQYTRLRIVVAEALDRTGVAGGVVDTGGTGGNLLRSGQILIAPPTRDLAGVGMGGVDRGAPSGPISMVSFRDGFAALSQTIGATLQSMAAVSERFEVVTGGGDGLHCDLLLKTWVTGATAGELTVDQVLESCDFGSAVSAVDGTIRYSGKDADVLLDRADVKRLLKNLIKTLPEPAEMGKGEILEREGRYVTVNMGKEQNVQKGMKAFAVSYGDRKVDTKSGITLGDEIFTGDLYIFAVYPKISRAWIVAEPADSLGDSSRVRVGDYVVFK